MTALEVVVLLNLIRPPYRQAEDTIAMPLNLMCLAGAVEPHFPVVITDLVPACAVGKISLAEAAERVLANPAPVLGFTAMSATYAMALRLAEECKRRDSSRFILLGGSHAGFVAQETLAGFPYIDAIVEGEGEETLVEFLYAFQAGRSFHGIPGLIFRDGSQIVRNPKREPVAELDSLPMPAFHLLPDVEAYFQGGRRTMEIEAGRGCPFNCSFCSTSAFFSRRYRMKSPGRLVAEMRWLKEHWGIQSFGFVHDNLTASRMQVLELCHYLRSCDETFVWTASSRTDTMDAELATAMHAAGCQALFFGVETGSPAMQQAIGKRLDVGRAQETIRQAMAAGLGSVASFIVGYPTETLADLESTLDMAVRLKATLPELKVQIHPLSPQPGTRILAENQDRLELHPEYLPYHDVAVGRQSDLPVEWLRRHPDIFSHAFMVPPRHYPLDLVYQIRGCMLHLCHRRPLTLLAMHVLLGRDYAAIATAVADRLNGAAHPWPEAAILAAFDQLVGAIRDSFGEAISDLATYEAAVEAVTQTKASRTAEAGSPVLKPLQVLHLRYDIPRLAENLRQAQPVIPAPRDLWLVVVKDGDNGRSLAVSPLIGHILSRTEPGAPVASVLTEMALQNPQADTEAKRQAWIDQVLTTFRSVRLLALDPHPTVHAP